MKCAAAGSLALACVLVAGCDKDDQYELHFSHYNHIEKYDVTCSDCHGESENGAFAKPSHASCVDCHDDWMEDVEVGEDTCGNCHVAKNLDAFAEREIPEAETPTAGVFVHTDALEGKCADCHGNLFGKDMTRVPELTRNDVLRIREQAHRSGMDCTSCHVDMDPETPPPSHDVNWDRRHGEWGMRSDNACGVCHSEQSCRECHEVTMPKSHNNLWRLKTHGQQAAWDRERCMVCHESDSCDACHEEIRPQSHTAGWSRNHCAQCHESEAMGTGCSFCHQGGIDAHPNPHDAGWERQHCRSCHNGSPASENCDVCHDVDRLSEHPNPHGAGWERRHCTECHDGQLNGVSCGACHEASGISDHPNPHSASFRQSHCTSCHEGSQSQNECGICHEDAGSVALHDDFWPPVHDRFGPSANCSICHY